MNIEETAKIDLFADCRARILEALTPRDANPTEKHALGAFPSKEFIEVAGLATAGKISVSSGGSSSAVERQLEPISGRK